MSHHGSSDLDPKLLRSMQEEIAGWRHPAALTGDFYREPDNVYRGLSLSQASLEAPHLSPFKDYVGSDFYCEPDDILKGISIGVESPTSLLGGSLDLYKKGPSKAPECPSKVSPVSVGDERFAEAHHPPDVPTDPFFKLEVTTFTLSSRTSWDIGNDLLDFLKTRVVSSIAKVNRQKFTVKADVFVEASTCALKVRVYHVERGRYAVEFQRRSGDVVTFNRVFQQATNFMSPRFVPVKMAFKAKPEFDCQELLRLSMTQSQGEIAPLLDMAGLLDLPSLQAECAAALAEMAQDTRMASRLCTRRTFEDFKKLLQADQTDVAYPTARMLLFLAKCPEAVPCFADRGLLSMMLDKVQSKATCALVQQHLAQALNAAITRCAANLSQKVSDDITSDLVRAIKDMGVRDNLTVRNLKEAQVTLQLQCGGASGWP